MRTAYKCRANLDPDQTALLARTFGRVRLVRNKTLAERRRAYETDGNRTTCKQTAEPAFPNEVFSIPLQPTLRHQHTAFAGFFARRAYCPRSRTRTGCRSAHYTRSAFWMEGGRLRMANITAPHEFVWWLEEGDLATLNPTMVVASRAPDGRWYVTVAVGTGADEPELRPAAGNQLGVDLGVKEFAVTSGADRIANVRHLERKARNLTRYQRWMARYRLGPATRRKAKAKTKVAGGHRKVRHDVLHRTSTGLVRDADVIVVEDLAVANMVRNRKLARAISDCG